MWLARRHEGKGDVVLEIAGGKSGSGDQRIGGGTQLPCDSEALKPRTRDVLEQPIRRHDEAPDERDRAKVDRDCVAAPQEWLYALMPGEVRDDVGVQQKGSGVPDARTEALPVADDDKDSGGLPPMSR
jgi:hypothetical protein